MSEFRSENGAKIKRKREKIAHDYLARDGDPETQK